MIFGRSEWPLLLSGLAFGLLLLIGTLATRGRRPHPILHKATWLSLAAIGIAYFDGGAPFAALVVAMAAFNYWIAQAIEGVGTRGAKGRSARQWLASAIALTSAISLCKASSIQSRNCRIGSGSRSASRKFNSE